MNKLDLFNDEQGVSTAALVGGGAAALIGLFALLFFLGVLSTDSDITADVDDGKETTDEPVVPVAPDIPEVFSDIPVLLETLGLPFNPNPDAHRLQVYQDATSDWIFGRSDIEVGGSDRASDIIAATAIHVSLAVTQGVEVLNMCGDQGAYYIGCPPDAPPLPAGDYALLLSKNGAPMPKEADEQHRNFTYLFDLDGLPDNNWVNNEQFDWDFNQGTDTWASTFRQDGQTDYGFEVQGVESGNHIGGSNLNARSILFFDEPYTGLLIPFDDELWDPGTMTFRTASDSHDGLFTPDTYSGDVMGANPTEIPEPIFEDGFESGDTSAWSNTVP